MNKRQQKILFIEANIDSTVGGSHYSLLELLRALDRTRFTPHVVFFRSHPLTGEFATLAPITIHPPRRLLPRENERRSSFSSLLLSSYRALKRLFYFLRAFVTAIWSLRQIRPNLIHLNNGPVVIEWILAARMTGIPCVSHLRGHWRPRGIHRVTSRLVKHIIAVSESVANELEECPETRGRVSVVYNGVTLPATPFTTPEAARRTRVELGLEETDFVAAVISNIKEWKGQHVAVSACAAVAKNLEETTGIEPKRRLVCLIVGGLSDHPVDRSYANELQRFVADNRLDGLVRFIGYEKDVYKILGAIDLLLHTSIKPEPFGRVIVEGMACGVTVVATAHGGPLEIIEPGVSGFLVPPNDVEALAREIQAAYYRPLVERNAIAERARSRVAERFSATRHAREIEKIYLRYLPPIS